MIGHVLAIAWNDVAVELAGVRIEVGVGVPTTLRVVLRKRFVEHGTMVGLVITVVEGVWGHQRQLLCRVENVLRIKRFCIMYDVVQTTLLDRMVLKWKWSEEHCRVDRVLVPTRVLNMSWHPVRNTMIELSMAVCYFVCSGHVEPLTKPFNSHQWRTRSKAIIIRLLCRGHCKGQSCTKVGPHDYAS